ncbi:MAG: helix-turn-helix transcriptional regulator [Rhizomicrobium sp.]|jgi:AraC-like DNA-binding protein
MEFAVTLDQPNLLRPGASRRLRIGRPHAPGVSILNGRGGRFEGGADSPDLSLKWVPEGSAEYRSEGRFYRLAGATQLLLNRGQSYRMNMGEPSETFVLFFPKAIADLAWGTMKSSDQALPEIPTAAAKAGPALLHSLASLREAASTPEPDAERLRELCCATLNEIVSTVALRRKQTSRIRAAKRVTREELLRRCLRAQSYLDDMGSRATLAGAADAAALSQFHLIRLFKSVFDETPLAYGAARRLEHARSELLRTNRPIVDVATGAGYESRTAFDRAFARHFGITPGAVRASAA